MNVRVMVADDERVARNRLTRLLSEVGDAEIVAECSDGASTIAAVRTQKPDVLFLDIEMPEGGGFDVANAVAKTERAPMIVFVTAFDQYAVRAFEVHAADYLLKPFGADRLAVTWGRVRDQLARGEPGTGRVLAALDELRKARANPGFRDRLLVTTDGRTTIVKATELEWIEAAANYVKLHVGKTKHLLREPLVSLETQLDPSIFVRVHRSAIVNLEYIHEIQPWFSGDQVIILKSGERLKLSRTFRKTLRSGSAAERRCSDRRRPTRGGPGLRDLGVAGAARGSHIRAPSSVSLFQSPCEFPFSPLPSWPASPSAAHRCPRKTPSTPMR